MCTEAYGLFQDGMDYAQTGIRPLSRQPSLSGEFMQGDTMSPDECPVVNHTQPRPVGLGNAAIRADRPEFVAVPVRVNGWHRVCAFRPDQRQLVIIGIADCRHAVSMSRTRRVNFDVE